MKKFRKHIFALLASFLLIFNNEVVYSLPIYVHFYLAEKLLDIAKINLTDDEKNAFLSGVVYADIGRIKIDDLSIDRDGKKAKISSDSEEFANEMMKFVTNSVEKWFVFGFKLHSFQDANTDNFLNESFGVSKCSYLHYGAIDNYLKEKNKSYIFSNNLGKEEFLEKLDVNDISSLVENSLGKNKYGLIGFILKIFISIPEFLQSWILRLVLKKSYFDRKDLERKIVSPQYDLLQKTYKSLGIELSIDDLKKQEANLIAVSLLMSIYENSKTKNFENDTESCIDKITLESTNFLNNLIT